MLWGLFMEDVYLLLLILRVVSLRLHMRKNLLP